MRILHLVDTFDPNDPRDQYKIVKLCGQKGHATTVVTSNCDSDNNPRDKDYFKEGDDSLKPVDIVRVRGFKLKLPSLTPRSAYLPHPKLFSNYDLIHVYTVGSHSSFIGYFIKLIKPTKVVMRVEMSTGLFLRLKGNPAFKWIVLKLLTGADALYSYTRREKELLVEIGVPENKISIIPVGVDYANFSKIQKVGGNVTVGYLGRLLPFKGAHRLVQPLSKLMTECPDVRVIFAGPKTEVHYADSIINAMSANPNFSYLGYVPAMDFLKLCDIIIVPSLPDAFETGSIATLEAMAAGKAVITSNATPMNEYIEHRVSGLLVENDEQFYQYSKELIQAPDLRAELGRNARKRSLQFDLNVIFDKLELIYKSLVS